MTSWLSPPASCWAAPDEWLLRARRQGPLRYSELGPMRLFPPSDALSPWLAGVADAAWDEAGQPDPFVLIVVSGDDGRLANRFLEDAPKCLPALRYVSVNPFGSPISGVPLEEPALLFPAGSLAGVDEEEAPPAVGVGPLLTALGNLPSLPGTSGAVVAVQFLSRQPTNRYEWRDGEWYELRVAARDDELVEVSVPAPGAPSIAPAPGRHVDAVGASSWLGRMLACLGEGSVVALDEWGGEIEQLSRMRRPVTGPSPVFDGLESVTWHIA